MRDMPRKAHVQLIILDFWVDLVDLLTDILHNRAIHRRFCRYEAIDSLLFLLGNGLGVGGDERTALLFNGLVDVFPRYFAAKEVGWLGGDVEAGAVGIDGSVEKIGLDVGCVEEGAVLIVFERAG